jgi:DNA-binding beta-propeller fold protein YncE
MDKSTIPRRTKALAAGIFVTAFGSAQVPASVDFHHLYTFGSKLGIHPPRILNRKLAQAALGAGEHPYGLAFPVGVTTDQKRRVWITDSGTASVHVFDQANGVYREIRRAGEYALQQPAGIAMDTGGRIYLADSGTGGLYVFDEQGEYDRAMVKPGTHRLEQPSAVALSADQRTVYVVDPPKDIVVALNREGEVNSTIQLPSDLSDPGSLVVVHNQVYVLGNQQHKVSGFSPGGRARGPLGWDGVRFPTAFTFDVARKWFFVANPQFGIVQIFDEQGRNLGAFGQFGDGVDQMQRVDSLYVDAQGLVYVVDSRRGKVVVFADSAQP